MNVEPTADIIDDMARALRSAADQLDRRAAFMREDKDFDHAAEVANTIGNLMSNLRLDLLVTRPLREAERERQRMIKANLDKVKKGQEQS